MLANLQFTCHRCNCGKRHELAYFPHIPSTGDPNFDIAAPAPWI